MTTKNAILIVSLLYSSFLFADFNQYVPHVLKEYKGLEGDEDEDRSHFLHSGAKESKTSGDDDDQFMSPYVDIGDDEPMGLTDAQELKSFSNHSPDVVDTRTYISTENEAVFAAIHNTGKYAFSLYWIYNQYDVNDNRNIFDRTFDSAGSTNGGTLHVNIDHYFSRGVMNYALGINVGAGFHSGKGVFARTGKQSTTTFKLWTIPVDFAGTVEFNFARLLKFGLSAGPSVMGLMQVRDDVENGSAERRRRQIGWGYFGAVKVKVNLTSMSDNFSFQMFRDYQISDMYLSLEARMHSYSNFQDDIEIEGASFGVGLTYEFL